MNIPPELLAMLQDQQTQAQAPELQDWRQFTNQEKDGREVVGDDTMGPLDAEQRFRGAYERKPGGEGIGQGKGSGMINTLMGGQ